MGIAKWLMPSCWWLLVVLQLVWHAVVPPPLGNGNWFLALFAVTPLLLVAPFALYRGERGRFWGMFLVMLYFVIAVTEAWSNPAQRVFALLQLLLCLGYFAGLVWLSRLESRR